MWQYWPEHYNWSYQVVRILSQSQYGGGEVHEVLDTCSRITPGNRDSFYREWMHTANRTLALANQALDRGRKETARAAYLRASNYFRTAEFFLPHGDERKLDTYLKSVGAFHSAMELMDHPPVRVQIPYENSFLPGYFYQVPGKSRTPLVILFGGLDSTAEEMYYCLAPEMMARGMSVLGVEGPGQGAALRLNHLPTRHDMEVAGTAALEYALKHLDIDPDRVAIMGFSMGGYHAARMAAFEPRFKACALYGAVYDYGEIWRSRPDNHPQAIHIMHVTGTDTIEAAREKLNKFTLKGVAEKIQCPTFIIHGEDDHHIPVSHAYRVFNDLTCPRELKIVPSGTPGSSHCQLDNFTQIFDMFDWLEEQLGA